jgi:hypothetical protein
MPSDAVREVVRFWDGQKYRFCPQCQEKAFQFAESFRSASQESQGRRLMHCPVDSPGVTHYEDEDCKEAGCVPVQESESRVKELEAMMKEVLQACLCDGDRQLKVRRRARAMLRLSGEPEKERA